MTEIPMPGDYGAPERQPPPQEKGCCSRCCECWMWILLGCVAIFVIWIILALSMGLWFFGLFG
ncbi:MAG: hypothetical protein ACFFFO_13945 [Candidatus Thorarchaeota archaeon]